MATSKDLIPDFMMDNPDDLFTFLMPFGLKPDLNDNIKNSLFNVFYKEHKTGKIRTTLVAPELFFTHFKFQVVYKNGKPEKKKYQPKEIRTQEYEININGSIQDNIKLGDILDNRLIMQLLGWNKDHVETAKKISCCLIKVNGLNLIIPHYAIAIYYYYRSTILRETILQCDLKSLYQEVDCNPLDASIVLNDFVQDEDAPFIHRFACQKEAQIAVDRLGTFLNAYMRTIKDKKKSDDHNVTIDNIPIKAMFPKQGKFTIWGRSSSFLRDGNTLYHFVHEIVNDNSDIGFTKFTTYYQPYVFDDEDDDSEKKPPKVPLAKPANTTPRLGSEAGSRKYKQRTIRALHKQKCASLSAVKMSTELLPPKKVKNAKVNIEDIPSDDEVDQGSTDSFEGTGRKRRKTNVSSKPQDEKIKGHTSNFIAFRQYINYLSRLEEVINFQLYGVQKMPTIMNGKDGKANPKCMIRGREREYITATFRYENSFVGLLELENTASTSTWVISSKRPFSIGIFDQFLKHHVDENHSIDEMKKMYDMKKQIRFRTKNHERSKELMEVDLIRWTAGILGKSL